MHPIMRDFPFEFETERLTIRGPLPGDGKEVQAAVAESIDELRPWMPWATEVPTVKVSEIRVREKYLDFLARRDLILHLFLQGTHTFIGSSGLHRIDWSVPSFEIGYWVRTSFSRKGFITEAVRGISNFAFEQLEAKRVEIRCDAKNVRSAAIPQRLGFVLEGTLRNEAVDHITGELRDTMIFAKIVE
ncbi:MAG: N-acetyltransferase [Chloroflexi bacterium]|nr:MAG: N-acetyltransferase [Chloroflexota bacterium]